MFIDVKMTIARYDDFITRPEQMAAEILSWAGLGWTSASKKYILARTTRYLHHYQDHHHPH